jgi:hypothetical protein
MCLVGNFFGAIGAEKAPGECEWGSGLKLEVEAGNEMGRTARVWGSAELRPKGELRTISSATSMNTSEATRNHRG